MGIRAFSGTLVLFVVAACFSWVNRTWFLDLWLSPLREAASRAGVEMHVDEQAALVVLMLKVTVATALLLTLPVFYAETWLLICRMTRREQARRLTIPFSVMSTGAALLALWLTRVSEVSFFVALL